jgi:hypothetical protein
VGEDGARQDREKIAVTDEKPPLEGGLEVFKIEPAIGLLPIVAGHPISRLRRRRATGFFEEHQMAVGETDILGAEMLKDTIAGGLCGEVHVVTVERQTVSPDGKRRADSPMPFDLGGGYEEGDTVRLRDAERPPSAVLGGF